MRIENLRAENSADRARVAATIVWEDCDRAPQEIYYETTREFGRHLTCDPHAFLTASVFPAIYHGERRIAIDAPICPELHNGLNVVIAWFHGWFGIPDTIQIETRGDTRYPEATPPRTGSFNSGGLDSLALLRANRLDFPRDHPNSIKDCLFVHGFDIGGYRDGEMEQASYDLALSALAAVARDAEVTLIPVYTNIRHLEDNLHFWVYQFHGPALASVAHAFSRRLTNVYVAAGYKIPVLESAATHPLIEPNLSSTGLRIRHEGIQYSRLDKVGLIGDWEAALKNLRVCTRNPPGQLNCGKCEKCLRTMLELLIWDRLDQATAFPAQDVTPDMVEKINFTDTYPALFYQELVAPLSAKGRTDLANVIQRKCLAFEKHLAWEEEKDWKGAVKRFDRRWLGGTLYKTYHAARMAYAHRAASK